MLEFIAAVYIGEVIGLAITGLMAWFFFEVAVALIDAIINTILSIPKMLSEWFNNTLTAMLNWVTNIPTEIFNWITTLL